MPMTLSAAFANAMDHGVSTTVINGLEATNNGAAINRLLQLGKHVLFPSGRYKFQGVLHFRNADQQCLFLAGAVLEPFTSDSYILISGMRQTFTGLRIEAPASVPARSPLVEIYRASELVMEGLHVSVASMCPSLAGPKAAVRLMFLRGCSFIGGAITGNQESGSVGLWLASSYDYASNDPNPSPGEWNSYSYLRAASERGTRQRLGQTTSGAYEVSASGLVIDSFGWGVRIGCITENACFTGCTFSDNVDGALVVRDDADVVWHATDGVPTQTVATGLTVAGCHFRGATPPQYIHVQRADAAGGGSIQGGVVLGCTFGSTGGEPAGSAAPSAALQTVPKGSQRMIPSVSVAGSLMRSGLRPRGLVPVGQDSATPPGSIAGESGGGPQFGSRLVAPPSRGAEPSQAVGKNDVGDACIFLAEGAISGVVVSGCYSAPSASRQYVWRIEDTATVSQTCDSFNSWAEPTIAFGLKASRLTRLSVGQSGRLKLTAEAVSLSAAKVGFSGAAPIERSSYVFRAPGSGDRSLRPGRERLVLAQLLKDLSALGLIKHTP